MSSTFTEVSADEMMAKIRRILKEFGRLSTDADSLTATDALYEAGLTSHASVNVMLALESEFEVEFPDEMLKRGTFDSVGSIRNALETLLTSA